LIDNIIIYFKKKANRIYSPYSFTPASLFLASSVSVLTSGRPEGIPGSASFQRERNFS
jgi:hypothetical protein